MSTTTAGKVAAEFRKLADSLDANPEAEIEKPSIYFYCDAKNNFVSTVKLLPRPLAKTVSDKDDPKWARVRVEYRTDVIDVEASIPQSLTCELIEPAKPAVYRCDPILSLEEEAEVSA
ncbi:MAG TPA: hypothetical protein VN517_03875 [Terriglobales bacterium]|nr:hypothetical protein [Terriglobales bacterium]